MPGIIWHGQAAVQDPGRPPPRIPLGAVEDPCPAHNMLGTMSHDALIVGSWSKRVCGGDNARALGLDVLVLEAADRAGGAVADATS